MVCKGKNKSKTYDSGVPPFFETPMCISFLLVLSFLDICFGVVYKTTAAFDLFPLHKAILDTAWSLTKKNSITCFKMVVALLPLVGYYSVTDGQQNSPNPMRLSFNQRSGDIQ